MAVNGLLQYYVGQARDEGIRCEVYAECGDLANESEDLTARQKPLQHGFG